MRSDKFSPANIKPQDFHYLFQFCNGQNPLTFGFPINNDLIVKLRADRPRDFANIHGGNYSCDICGAHYNEGEAWEHIETKEIITIGHQCAMKYSLAADDAEFENEKAQAVLARKRAAAREQKASMLREIYESHPGLEDALNTKHYIVEDIKARLERWGSISEKQIELVFKLANQINNPKVEEWIAVPKVEGRQTVTGTVIAHRWDENYFGHRMVSTLKVLVKVETDAGNWKTWGTLRVLQRQCQHRWSQGNQGSL
jgi:hypothetical protein